MALEVFGGKILPCINGVLGTLLLEVLKFLSAVASPVQSDGNVGFKFCNIGCWAAINDDGCLGLLADDACLFGAIDEPGFVAGSVFEVSSGRCGIIFGVDFVIAPTAAATAQPAAPSWLQVTVRHCETVTDAAMFDEEIRALSMCTSTVASCPKLHLTDTPLPSGRLTAAA